MKKILIAVLENSSPKQLCKITHTSLCCVGWCCECPFNSHEDLEKLIEELKGENR